MAEPKVDESHEQPDDDLEVVDPAGPRDLGPVSTPVAHPVRGKKFDPAPAREQIRGLLAVAAFAVFTLFAAVLVVVIAAGWRTWKEMEGVSGVLLPAIMSVLGTTTGFYFGVKSRDGNQ